MTISAKYRGTCPTCGGAIHVGDRIEWSKGAKPTHVTCPTQKTTQKTSSAPVALVRGGARIGSGSNRKPGYCDSCGGYVAVGAGRLEYCVEDSGCMRHHDHGGYHLYCLDTAACSTQRAAQKAEAEAALAVAAAVKAIVPQRVAQQSLTDHVTDGEADAQWRALAGVTLEVRAREGRVGSCDAGTFCVVGEDLVYHHGGYYDDYRTSVGRIVGGAAAYLEALRAVLPETTWTGQTQEVVGYCITITRR